MNRNTEAGKQQLKDREVQHAGSTGLIVERTSSVGKHTIVVQGLMFIRMHAKCAFLEDIV